MLMRPLVVHLAALTALATFGLGPYAPLPLQILVISGVQLAQRELLVNVRNAGVPRSAASLKALAGEFGILAALMVGCGLSFVLSAEGSGELVAGLETVPALIYYSFTAVFVPVVAIALGELVAYRLEPASWSGLLIRGWLFALGGVTQERLSGVGRTVWWIHGGHDLGWAARWVGPSGLDLVWGIVAAAVSEVLQPLVRTRQERLIELDEDQGDDEAVAPSPYRDEQSDDDPAHWDTNSNLSSDIKPAPSTAYSPSKLILAATLALLVLSPYLPTLTPSATHPSHTDPAYTYPPVKVGCVAPLVAPNHHKTTPASELEGWLAETRRVAGTGARVVSWSEGAVRLEKGKGKEEELWARVAGVADQYKVHILATYLLPAPSPASSHKLLNIATLIAPSTQPNTTNVVWSTYKHLPVPFVESYSHSARLNPALGSTANSLPLATIHLPHGKNTPGPHETPLQPLAVTAGICLDVASPGLFQHYALSTGNDDTDGEHEQHSPGSLRSPGLILNPSSVPPPASLALTQLEQAQARAVESNSWLLRCDGPSGLSALVSPRGEVRALRVGSEGWGSWEAEIGADGAREESFYARWLGGSEWAVLGGAAAVWLVGTGVRAAVVRRRKGGLRVGMGEGVRGGWARVKGAAVGVRETVAGGRTGRDGNLIDF